MRTWQLNYLNLINTSGKNRGKERNRIGREKEVVHVRSKRELGERKRTENAGPSEKTSLKISCFQLPRTAERKVEREREGSLFLSCEWWWFWCWRWCWCWWAEKAKSTPVGSEYRVRTSTTTLFQAEITTITSTTTAVVFFTQLRRHCLLNIFLLYLSLYAYCRVCFYPSLCILVQIYSSTWEFVFWFGFWSGSE